MNDTPPFTYSNPYQKTQSSEQIKKESFDVPSHTIYAEPAYEGRRGPSPVRFAMGILVLLILVSGVVGFFVWIIDDEQLPVIPSIEEEVANTKHVQKGEAVFLRTEDGAELIVPEGALEEDTVLGITRVASGYLTARYKLIPDGLTFAKPVTVRVPYNEAAFHKAKTVSLNVWNDGTPRTAMSYRVDAIDKKLTTSLTQF